MKRDFKSYSRRKSIVGTTISNDGTRALRKFRLHVGPVEFVEIKEERMDVSICKDYYSLY